MADEKKTPWAMILGTVVGGGIGFLSGGISSVIIGLVTGLLGGFVADAAITTFSKKDGNDPNKPVGPDGKPVGGDGKEKEGPDAPGKGNALADALKKGWIVKPEVPLPPDNPLRAHGDVRSSTLPTLEIGGIALLLQRGLVQPGTNYLLNRGRYNPARLVTGPVHWATGRELGLRYGVVPGLWRSDQTMVRQASQAYAQYHDRALRDPYAMPTQEEFRAMERATWYSKPRGLLGESAAANMDVAVARYLNSNPPGFFGSILRGRMPRFGGSSSGSTSPTPTRPTPIGSTSPGSTPASSTAPDALPWGIEVMEEGEVLRVTRDGRVSYEATDSRTPGLRIRYSTADGTTGTYVLDPDLDVAKFAAKVPELKPAIREAMLAEARAAIEVRTSGITDATVRETIRANAFSEATTRIDAALSEGTPGIPRPEVTLKSFTTEVSTHVDTVIRGTPGTAPTTPTPTRETPGTGSHPVADPVRIPAPRTTPPLRLVEVGARSTPSGRPESLRFRIASADNRTQIEVERVPVAEGLGDNIYRTMPPNELVRGNFDNGRILSVGSDGKPTVLQDGWPRGGERVHNPKALAAPGLRLLNVSATYTARTDMVLHPDINISDFINKHGASYDRLGSKIQHAILVDAEATIDASLKNVADADQKAALKKTAMDAAHEEIMRALEGPGSGSTTVRSLGERIAGVIRNNTGYMSNGEAVKPVYYRVGVDGAAEVVANPSKAIFREVNLAEADFGTGMEHYITPANETGSLRVEPVPAEHGLGDNVYRSEGNRYFKVEGIGPSQTITEITNTPAAQQVEAIRQLPLKNPNDVFKGLNQAFDTHPDNTARSKLSPKQMGEIATAYDAAIEATKAPSVPALDSEKFLSDQINAKIAELKPVSETGPVPTSDTIPPPSTRTIPGKAAAGIRLFTSEVRHTSGITHSYAFEEKGTRVAVEKVPLAEGRGDNVFRTKPTKPGEAVRYFRAGGATTDASLTEIPEPKPSQFKTSSAIEFVDDPARPDVATRNVSEHTVSIPGDGDTVVIQAKELGNDVYRNANGSRYFRIHEGIDASGKSTGTQTVTEITNTPELTMRQHIAKLPHGDSIINQFNDLRSSPDGVVRGAYENLTPNQLKTVAETYSKQLEASEKGTGPLIEEGTLEKLVTEAVKTSAPEVPGDGTGKVPAGATPAGINPGLIPLAHLSPANFNKGLNSGQYKLGVHTDTATGKQLIIYESTADVTPGVKGKYMIVSGKAYDITGGPHEPLVKAAIAERFTPPGRAHGLGWNGLGIAMSLPGVTSKDPFTQVTSTALLSSSGSSAVSYGLGYSGTGAALQVPTHVLMPVISGKGAYDAFSQGHYTLGVGKTVQTGLFTGQGIGMAANYVEKRAMAAAARRAGIALAARAGAAAPLYTVPFWGQLGFIAVEVGGGIVVGRVESKATVLNTLAEGSKDWHPTENATPKISSAAENYAELRAGNYGVYDVDEKLPPGHFSYNVRLNSIPADKKQAAAEAIARILEKEVNPQQLDQAYPVVLAQYVTDEAKAKELEAALKALGGNVTVNKTVKVTLQALPDDKRDAAAAAIAEVLKKDVAAVRWSLITVFPAPAALHITDEAQAQQIKDKLAALGLTATIDADDTISVNKRVGRETGRDRGFQYIGSTLAPDIGMYGNMSYLLANDHLKNRLSQGGKPLAFSMEDKRPPALRKNIDTVRNAIEAKQLEYINQILDMGNCPNKVDFVEPDINSTASDAWYEAVAKAFATLNFSQTKTSTKNLAANKDEGRNHLKTHEGRLLLRAAIKYRIDNPARFQASDEAYAHMRRLLDELDKLDVDLERCKGAYIELDGNGKPNKTFDIVRDSLDVRQPGKITKFRMKTYAEYYKPITQELARLQADVAELEKQHQMTESWFQGDKKDMVKQSLIEGPDGKDYLKLVKLVEDYEKNKAKYEKNDTLRYEYLTNKKNLLKAEVDAAVNYRRNLLAEQDPRKPEDGYYPDHMQTMGIAALPVSFTYGNEAYLAGADHSSLYDVRAIFNNQQVIFGQLDFSDDYKKKAAAFNNKLADYERINAVLPDDGRIFRDKTESDQWKQGKADILQALSDYASGGNGTREQRAALEQFRSELAARLPGASTVLTETMKKYEAQAAKPVPAEFIINTIIEERSKQATAQQQDFTNKLNERLNAMNFQAFRYLPDDVKNDVQTILRDYADSTPAKQQEVQRLVNALYSRNPQDLTEATVADIVKVMGEYRNVTTSDHQKSKVDDLTKTLNAAKRTDITAATRAEVLQTLAAYKEGKGTPEQKRIADRFHAAMQTNPAFAENLLRDIAISYSQHSHEESSKEARFDWIRKIMDGNLMQRHETINLSMTSQIALWPEYQQLRETENVQRENMMNHMWTKTGELVRENTALKLKAGYGIVGPVDEYLDMATGSVKTEKIIQVPIVRKPPTQQQTQELMKAATAYHHYKKDHAAELTQLSERIMAHLRKVEIYEHTKDALNARAAIGGGMSIPASEIPDYDQFQKDLKRHVTIVQTSLLLERQYYQVLDTVPVETDQQAKDAQLEKLRQFHTKKAAHEQWKQQLAVRPATADSITLHVTSTEGRQLIDYVAQTRERQMQLEEYLLQGNLSPAMVHKPEYGDFSSMNANPSYNESVRHQLEVLEKLSVAERAAILQANASYNETIKDHPNKDQLLLVDMSNAERLAAAAHAPLPDFLIQSENRQVRIWAQQIRDKNSRFDVETFKVYTASTYNEKDSRLTYDQEAVFREVYRQVQVAVAADLFGAQDQKTQLEDIAKRFAIDLTKPMAPKPETYTASDLIAWPKAVISADYIPHFPAITPDMNPCHCEYITIGQAASQIRSFSDIDRNGDGTLNAAETALLKEVERRLRNQISEDLAAGNGNIRYSREQFTELAAFARTKGVELAASNESVEEKALLVVRELNEYYTMEKANARDAAIIAIVSTMDGQATTNQQKMDILARTDAILMKQRESIEGRKLLEMLRQHVKSNSAAYNNRTLPEIRETARDKAEDLIVKAHAKSMEVSVDERKAISELRSKKYELDKKYRETYSASAPNDSAAASIGGAGVAGQALTAKTTLATLETQILSLEKDIAAAEKKYYDRRVKAYAEALAPSGRIEAGNWEVIQEMAKQIRSSYNDPNNKFKLDETLLIMEDAVASLDPTRSVLTPAEQAIRRSNAVNSEVGEAYSSVTVRTHETARGIQKTAFARIDANGDGVLDAQELQVFLLSVENMEREIANSAAEYETYHVAHIRERLGMLYEVAKEKGWSVPAQSELTLTEKVFTMLKQPPKTPDGQEWTEATTQHYYKELFDRIFTSRDQLTESETRTAVEMLNMYRSGAAYHGEQQLTALLTEKYKLNIRTDNSGKFTRVLGVFNEQDDAVFDKAQELYKALATLPPANNGKAWADQDKLNYRRGLLNNAIPSKDKLTDAQRKMIVMVLQQYANPDANKEGQADLALILKEDYKLDTRMAGNFAELGSGNRLAFVSTPGEKATNSPLTAAVNIALSMVNVTSPPGVNLPIPTAPASKDGNKAAGQSQP